MAQEFTQEQVRQICVNEANQDVLDMNKGLLMARKMMDTLLTLVHGVSDAADIKRIIRSNAAAVQTIRKIRSLDAEAVQEPTTEVNVTVSSDPGFSKLRQAFRNRLAHMGDAPASIDAHS
ncbi:hypothetical protein ABC383_07195 [Noviherbaspirillum sp. 1P10PC]|uniref:hypothetical protein n=1 Tax=Noviherbaspirillum sp. 1P10PC TaxID=3132292 RepID=UPI0039A01848